jgi:hypothetical protein
MSGPSHQIDHKELKSTMYKLLCISSMRVNDGHVSECRIQIVAQPSAFFLRFPCIRNISILPLIRRCMYLSGCCCGSRRFCHVHTHELQNSKPQIYCSDAHDKRHSTHTGGHNSVRNSSHWLVYPIFYLV